ncbi:MAG: SAM-dependent methyltransferase [Candidatus Latescibacterota bacterium]|jgi:SAM-dependent methyltransferase
MTTPVLDPTRCAICQTADNSSELHPANFSVEALNPEVFSARRLPDRVHYRMARCNTCGLVRSDPVAHPDLLAQLYQRSEFTYASHTEDLRRTYGRYLRRLERHRVRKGSLLEIGCGNGFFLGEALDQGYAEVHGVEPSSDAIAHADERVRKQIVCDMMRPGLFAPASFDVICLFQVFDHISDPHAVIEECARILRPGGLVLFFQHNIRAVSARLLGELSPIIDIEHTFLYCAQTLARLCALSGLETIDSGAAFNTYSLSYLVRLLPLPSAIKKMAIATMEKTPIGRVRLNVPLGNMYLIAGGN